MKTYFILKQNQYLQEKTQEKTIQPFYVHIIENITDIFTKAINKIKHSKLTMELREKQKKNIKSYIATNK
jgi:uncharacterized protein (UPF0305 family)